MQKTFKKYFISHSENNFHAHLLHTKRAVFYSLVFLLTKGILVAFVLFLPVEAFVLPDVLAEEQRQILALTNELRRDKNISILAVADKLNSSAQSKAEDMSNNNYFAHANNNRTLSNWLKDAGYQYEVAGENLAVGFSSAEDIVAAWQKSPTHYANLIDTDFKELGIGLSGGVYKGQPTVFIAQHFAAPSAPIVKEEPKVIARRSSAVEIKVENPVETLATPVDSAVLAGKVKNEEPQALVVSDKPSSPVTKYIQAKSVLSPLTNIFAVSKNIYLGAMIFFAFVLLINIVIHIRKQHYHIIAQTSGLIALLFIFWKF